MTTSPVVRAGDLLFTGALVAVDSHGTKSGDPATQTRTVLDGLRELLAEQDATLDDVVAVVSFHRDLRRFEEVLDAAAEYFTGAPPAWTPVGFIGAAQAGAEVAFRVIADLGSDTKQSIRLESQPWLRRYPMASGCRKGNLLFIAGQTGADEAGAAVRPTSHLDQAHTAYERIKEVLASAGASVDDILDFTSYHVDMRGAEPTFNEVYVPEVIGRVPVDDAATCSHVGTAGLFRPGLLGAYTSVADLTPGNRTGSTPDSVWWKDAYPLAAATRKPGGKLITIAGHVAAHSDGSIICPGDHLGQLRYILDSMSESLGGYGLSLEHVADVTAFAKDPRMAESIHEVMSEYFSRDDPPAMSIVGMPGLWLEGFQLEVAGLAIAPDDDCDRRTDQ